MSKEDKDAGLFQEGMRVVTLKEVEDLTSPPDPSEHALPVSPAGVRAAAGKAEGQGQKALTGLSLVQDILVKELVEQTRFQAPDWKSVKEGRPKNFPEGVGDYAKTLDALMAMAKKYQGPIPPPREGQKDLINIGAHLAYLASNLSYFQAMVANTNSRLDRFRSVAYVRAKQVGADKGSRISDDTAKELARSMSDPIAQELEAYELAEKLLRNTYYSFQSFLEIMNFVIGREMKAQLPPPPYRE